MPRDAGFHDLSAFAVALGLDPLGGALAQATGAELARVVSGSWGADPDAPSALVVIGLPCAEQHVA
ncbi:MAG: hypothetical protein IT378_05200 [Sandaracinaceae bacterium]|nr:hypothetical protein [Sandaracinaceae bacterium]